MLDVVLDALKDTAIIFPVVFIVYIIIELVEAREALKHSMGNMFTSRFSPFFGALIGVIPQCGFSVVATKLYQGKYIYLGTLIAVYFATSDEAIPILFSRAITQPSMWKSLGLLIAIKFTYAIIVGFAINFVLNKIMKKSVASASGCFAEESFSHDEDGCCGHGITEERHGFKQFVLHPLIHSLKIILYILVINLLMGFIIFFAFNGDEGAFSAFISNKSIFAQPVLAALVGLIPNCASSVVLAELYADKALSLGGALAGLTLNSGLGLAVLLKDKTNFKKSILIILLMFVLSLILGYGVLLFEVI